MVPADHQQSVYHQSVLRSKRGLAGDVGGAGGVGAGGDAIDTDHGGEPVEDEGGPVDICVRLYGRGAVRARVARPLVCEPVDRAELGAGLAARVAQARGGRGRVGADGADRTRNRIASTNQHPIKYIDISTDPTKEHGTRRVRGSIPLAICE